MTTAPVPWAGERSFHDALYEWMERAPWLALSAAAHVLVYLVLAAIPWEQFRAAPAVVVQARIDPQPVDLVERPEPPPELVPPELDEPVPSEEPMLLSDETLDVPDDPSPSESSERLDPTLAPADVRFGELTPLGLGAGAPLGGHAGPRGTRRGLPGGSGVEPALEDALAWLAAHQSEDGGWDGDGFAARCGAIGAGACEGAGAPTHDVGVSALALLAFLGDGHTQNEGLYRERVARGLAWLVAEQDPETGLVGERSSHDFLYDHALATLALCEAYYFTKSPLLKRPAQRAVNLVLNARNPYGAWRYDVPPIGDSDTSVTGWMVFALASARDAGLEGDFEAAFAGALAWLDEVSDSASGRVGYDGPGSLSSRTPANEHFPRERGEAMTAVALLCRIFLGQRPEDHPILARHAELLRAKPPVWDPEGHASDLYYWYYGTYALFQMGRPWWPVWEKAMKAAVVESQSREGDERGSWDPAACPWGDSGGRVYSTALMALALEVYFRYSRVLGAR